jgi:hypothetical protein
MGRNHPYEHQGRTAEFITAHLRCGIWNEQGTGKHMQRLPLRA